MFKFLNEVFIKKNNKLKRNRIIIKGQQTYMFFTIKNYNKVTKLQLILFFSKSLISDFFVEKNHLLNLKKNYYILSFKIYSRIYESKKFVLMWCFPLKWELPRWYKLLKIKRNLKKRLWLFIKKYSIILSQKALITAVFKKTCKSVLKKKWRFNRFKRFIKKPLKINRLTYFYVFFYIKNFIYEYNNSIFVNILTFYFSDVFYLKIFYNEDDEKKYNHFLKKKIKNIKIEFFWGLIWCSVVLEKERKEIAVPKEKINLKIFKNVKKKIKVGFLKKNKSFFFFKKSFFIPVSMEKKKKKKIKNTKITGDITKEDMLYLIRFIAEMTLREKKNKEKQNSKSKTK